MAAITWRNNPSLKEALEKKAEEFELYEAIHILEALQEKKGKSEAEENKEGEFQLKSHVTLAPSGGDIYKLSVSHKKRTLWVNILGIAGVHGPLPLPYTEKIIERIQKKDTAFRDFLDIFNHRLILLWYHFQKKFLIGFERVFPEKSKIGRSLLQLIGLTETPLLNKQFLELRDILPYQTLLWQRTRSTEGLTQILKSYFQENVHIEEFKGAWNNGSKEDLSYIGNKKGSFNLLGANFILGSKSWDEESAAVVSLGPLRWITYCRFLPATKNFNTLKGLAYLHVNFRVQLFLKLILQRAEIRPVFLNREFSLGYNTWLPCDRPPQN